MSEEERAEELLRRQKALQADAADVFATMDLGGLFRDIGPVAVVGSYVSGLMCWRDLDICVLVTETFSPDDVLALLRRIVALPGVVGFGYRDERGARSPTGQPRDERYHVTVEVDIGGGAWRIDLSLWLRDLHENLVEWHTRLRDTITPEQRLAVLRIKDVWHRLPTYPDQVSGLEIYTAVCEHGVRTPEQFAHWLSANGPAEPASSTT
jgi:hypothetical protein